MSTRRFDLETAVIIAGGLGLRLRPITNDIPKTLLSINRRPVLEWILRWLQNYGIKHVVIGVAYRKEKVMKFTREKHYPGIDFDMSEHTVEGGTAEAFRKAIHHVDSDDFVAMNSDELTTLNLRRMIRLHQKKRPLITMALAPYRTRFSVATLDPNQDVNSFVYGKTLSEVLVSIGIYIFNKDLIKYIPETGSIEKAVFERLSGRKKIAGYLLKQGEDWISVNDQKDVVEAERRLKIWSRKHGAYKSNQEV